MIGAWDPWLHYDETTLYKLGKAVLSFMPICNTTEKKAELINLLLCTVQFKTGCKLFVLLSICSMKRVLQNTRHLRC